MKRLFLKSVALSCLMSFHSLWAGGSEDAMDWDLNKAMAEPHPEYDRLDREAHNDFSLFDIFPLPLTASPFAVSSENTPSPIALEVPVRIPASERPQLYFKWTPELSDRIEECRRRGKTAKAMREDIWNALTEGQQKFFPGGCTGQKFQDSLEMRFQYNRRLSNSKTPQEGFSSFGPQENFKWTLELIERIETHRRADKKAKDMREDIWNALNEGQKKFFPGGRDGKKFQDSLEMRFQYNRRLFQQEGQCDDGKSFSVNPRGRKKGSQPIIEWTDELSKALQDSLRKDIRTQCQLIWDLLNDFQRSAYGNDPLNEEFKTAVILQKKKKRKELISDVQKRKNSLETSPSPTPQEAVVSRCPQASFKWTQELIDRIERHRVAGKKAKGMRDDIWNALTEAQQKFFPEGRDGKKFRDSLGKRFRNNISLSKPQKIELATSEVVVDPLLESATDSLTPAPVLDVPVVIGEVGTLEPWQEGDNGKAFSFKTRVRKKGPNSIIDWTDEMSLALEQSLDKDFGTQCQVIWDLLNDSQRSAYGNNSVNEKFKTAIWNKKSNIKKSNPDLFIGVPKRKSSSQKTSGPKRQKRGALAAIGGGDEFIFKLDL